MCVVSHAGASFDITCSECLRVCFVCTLLRNRVRIQRELRGLPICGRLSCESTTEWSLKGFWRGAVAKKDFDQKVKLVVPICTA